MCMSVIELVAKAKTQKQRHLWTNRHTKGDRQIVESFWTLERKIALSHSTVQVDSMKLAGHKETSAEGRFSIHYLMSSSQKELYGYQRLREGVAF